MPNESDLMKSAVYLISAEAEIVAVAFLTSSPESVVDEGDSKKFIELLIELSNDEYGVSDFRVMTSGEVVEWLSENHNETEPPKYDA